MIDTASLAAFGVASLLIELTPGPNMTYLALIAATEGRRRAFAAVAGVALGLSVIGLATALGVTAMLGSSPLAYQGLRWAGFFYLLWLAWDGWRDNHETAPLAGPGSAYLVYFWRGLVTNLLNPKAAVFFVTVVPTFLAAGAPKSEAVMLSAIYVGIATFVHVMIVSLAGATQPWLANPKREKITRRGLSVGLVAVAIWMIWRS